MSGIVHIAEPRRRALIVEPRSSGHLLVYVARIIGARPDLDVTLLTTSASRSSREYEEHLGHIGADFDTFEVESVPDVKTVLSVARRSRADVVIIPHGDTYVAPFLRSLWRRRTVRTRLLVMRDPRWERPAPPSRRVKNLLKLAMVRVLSIDRRLEVLWLREPGYVSRRRDFVIDPFIADVDIDRTRALGASIAEEAGLDTGIFWFGVTGAITSRKNVDMIVGALVLARAAAPTALMGLALIGPVVDLGGRSLDELAKALYGANISLRVVDRLLSNDEMNGAVLALDCVVMAYSSHSPNSTLGKAKILGTRVVAAGPPSVQGFATMVHGALVSDLTIEKLSQSLVASMATDRPTPERFQDGSRSFAEQLIGF